MERHSNSFKVSDVKIFKQKVLIWTKQFSTFCLLDNHDYTLPYQTYNYLLAAGAATIFKPTSDFFGSLSNFYNDTSDWIFGHFNYDLKNKIENLSSNNPDHQEFVESYLFVPETLLRLDGDEVTISTLSGKPSQVFEEINNVILSDFASSQSDNIDVKARINKVEYKNIIDALRRHILQGDCYEINFCQEFYAENCAIDPYDVYDKLTNISPTPYACFYKIDSNYLICASPERFLKKQDNTIISQPIKGTIKRDMSSVTADSENIAALQSNSKERSENVMIVDLVRNDLSKICEEGSVLVSDLFGVQTFPQLHQMVSTIKGRLKEGMTLSEILLATFPMGSMTGAPKKKVMELIEHYECTKRGIYSGTVGYITPEKNFDFNVVIRSIIYNSISQYLSYQVGSAITYNSNSEDEYNECLLKAEGIKKALQ